MQNQDESGRSMIEMLGVLGIMGVIVYGAVSGINYGIDVYKINATYHEIDELAQAIIDLSSWRDDYIDLGTNPSLFICKNDAFPCTEGNEMKNQWNGDVEVEMILQDGKRTAFKITYNDVPEAVCNKLKDEAGFQHVCVNKTETTCSGDVNISFYSRSSDKCSD